MYKIHAEFFVQILVKPDPLFIGQSELRSFFESLLSATGNFSLVSDLAQEASSSLQQLPTCVPMDPMDSLLKPVIYYV